LKNKIPNIAIIGAGISGLSAAHFLNDRYKITVFERDEKPGGLIKCRRVNGNLFHTCGGHVFNSKRQDVLDWFWSFFDKEKEFCKAERNACLLIDKDESSLNYIIVPYPIEDHVYCLDENTQKKIYDDFEEIDQVIGSDVKFTDYENFDHFLRWRFGKTLYHLYFQPYNEKVWKCDLTSVPLSWMEGKLPMPTTKEMRDNNANFIEEKSFVHSSFWYARSNGSQFIADKLAKGLTINYNSDVTCIERRDNKWVICGEIFDKVVFCGNIKEMAKMISGVDISDFLSSIDELKYRGTTSVFCEIDNNSYSWIYQPSRKHQSHRIICTGNLAATNNVANNGGRITATIEFVGQISKKGILDNLKRIPFNPNYLDHVYNQYTYPIQNARTRDIINDLKKQLSPLDFYFTGRFADWEYYNMDVAIGAAMDLCKVL